MSVVGREVRGCRGAELLELLMRQGLLARHGRDCRALATTASRLPDIDRVAGHRLLRVSVSQDESKRPQDRIDCRRRDFATTRRLVVEALSIRGENRVERPVPEERD